MTTSNRRTSGLSYQASAVILAVVGMCAWVAHDALTGAAPVPQVMTAAGDPAQAGDVYVTAPQADSPPIVLMVAPAEPGAASAAGPSLTASADGARGTTEQGTTVHGVVTAVAPAAPAGSGARTGAGTIPTTTAGPTTPKAPPDRRSAPVLVVPTGGDAGPGQQAAYQVIAADGSIVYVGANGHLVANTGAVSSSGVLALGSDGSDLRSGRSASFAAPDAAANGHANGTFQGLLQGSDGGRTAAISGFEDHSVSVLGNDQVVTYDDSNVFLGRDGQINANTGDTDSSGLNAVDVTGSVVRSGNSGDAEDEEDGEEEDGEEEEDDEEEEDSEENDEPRPAGGAADVEEGPAAPLTGPPAGTGHATVTDEGESSADGPGALVVGADGFDDVSVRSRGDRDVVTYDDSNVVIGGSGPVNTQIGDSDTGGATVMGIHGSDVRAGCEGDLCYSD